MHLIISKFGSNLTSLRLDFAYHFADDLEATNVHLCTTIRDNCQSLEYLTLSFPPPDKLDDAPRATICHQLFRAPVSCVTQKVGMLSLKRVEIIGHHSYCEGSSRKMVVDASEDVWETQSQMRWDTAEKGQDYECLHTNIQIHGTPARKKSLLNCRELRCIPSTLSAESSYRTEPRRGRSLENVLKYDRIPILTLQPRILERPRSTSKSPKEPSSGSSASLI
jgi:hypothetical protein